MRYLPFLLMLLLASCAGTEQLTAGLSQPLDSTVQRRLAAARRQVAGSFNARSVKFNGPVTLQIAGTGNTGASTDATKTKAPVAAAPHAVATETNAGGPPWYVYAGIAVVCLVVGGVLAARLSIFHILGK